MNTIVLSLTDQLPSGKNRIKEQFVQNKKIPGRFRKIRYPNQRFKRWRASAAAEIAVQRSRFQLAIKGLLPINTPVNLKVLYVPRDHIARDQDGLLSAIFHLLEYCEIVEDDKLIRLRQWDDCEMSETCSTTLTLTW